MGPTKSDSQLQQLASRFCFFLSSRLFDDCVAVLLNTVITTLQRPCGVDVLQNGAGDWRLADDWQTRKAHSPAREGLLRSTPIKLNLLCLFYIQLSLGEGLGVQAYIIYDSDPEGVDLGRDTRTSTQSRRLVQRKDASWSLNWPSRENFPAQKQHMYFFLVPL